MRVSTIGLPARGATARCSTRAGSAGPIPETGTPPGSPPDLRDRDACYDVTPLQPIRYNRRGGFGDERQKLRQRRKLARPIMPVNLKNP